MNPKTPSRQQRRHPKTRPVPPKDSKHDDEERSKALRRQVNYSVTYLIASLNRPVAVPAIHPPAAGRAVRRNLVQRFQGTKLQSPARSWT